MTETGTPDGRALGSQVAVVTGAGRGIGRAIALAWAAEGAHVVCSARNRDEIEDTARAIIDRGGSASALVADVTSSEAMEELMGGAYDGHGRLDLVLLNAGISAADEPIETLPLAEWQRCVDTNLTGAFLGIKAATPHLRASGGGKIIGVGSGSSIHSPARRSPYSATKAALTALLRSASRELRPFHIAVNELQPGPTATAMHGVTANDPTEQDIADHPLRQREGGHWFKAPQIVGEFACFIARLPNDGPTGQVFALNSFR